MIEPRNYYRIKEVDTVLHLADNTVLILMVRITQLFRGLRTWRGRMISISWERGTNENINKVIRRFISKGVDIANYSDKEIKRVENCINNYPRLISGELPANIMEQKYITA